MEGKTQRIVLHDEDAEVFRTFVAWLYRGHLSCNEIRKVFGEKYGFEDHITAILLFADSRDVPKLTDDATTLLLDFLEKTGSAQPLTIDRIYLLPDDRCQRMLLFYLVTDELYFHYRIDSDAVYQLNSEFVVAVLRESLVPREKRGRIFPSDLLQDVYCSYYHKHSDDETCSSRALNRYDGPVTVLRPYTSAGNIFKKRKTVQTSTPLVDGPQQHRRRVYEARQQ